MMLPCGRLLHSVTGPVSAEELLSETNWALQMAHAIEPLSSDSQISMVSQYHQAALSSPRGNQDRKVHELFAQNPLPPMQMVYEEIFERILGQKVSKAGPRLRYAETQISRARSSGRPILFVLHSGHGDWAGDKLTVTARQLMNEYAVIAMPQREAPALSQLTGQPPFQSDSHGGTIFVVTRSDCKQLYSGNDRQPGNLERLLANGWADTIEQNPPSIGTCLRAQRLLKKIDSIAAERVRQVTIELQEAKRQQIQLKTAKAKHDEESIRS